MRPTNFYTDNMNIKEELFKAIMREEDDRSRGIHVTSLVYDCLRRGYYENKFEEGFFDMKTLITFWIGKAVHKTPILKNHELKLEWNGITGTVDEYQDGIIIDKKTTTYTPKSPNGHHIKQIEYYAVLLSKNGYRVREGHLIYININDKDIVVFPIKIRSLEDVEAEMVEKKIILENSIRDKTEPRRSPGWLCGYCNYAGVCFKEKKE